MDPATDPGLYRLEGTDKNEAGGLIIRKKPSDHTFKKPQVSVLGLDKLAKKKRLENAQEIGGSRSESGSSKPDGKERKYRSYAEETPTYTGGVNTEAQKRLEARLKRQRLSAQENNHRRDYRDRDRDRDRSRDRDRDRDRGRSRNRDSVRDSSRQTPLRFKDEPQTPVFKTKVPVGFYAVGRSDLL